MVEAYAVLDVCRGGKNMEPYWRSVCLWVRWLADRTLMNECLCEEHTVLKMEKSNRNLWSWVIVKDEIHYLKEIILTSLQDSFTTCVCLGATILQSEMFGVARTTCVFSRK